MPRGIYKRSSFDARLEKHTLPEPNTGCLLWGHRVNIDHLELGTVTDNNRDREKRGRGRWTKPQGAPPCLP